ncbi:hypothetical protein [Devosia sp. 2618]|uniref:hypothetical protein n=1 Tax=Devosia sp. 2618 TaxID=3156454 RepID=UPI003396B408
MKLWGALSNAVIGWVMILRGDDSWREHFKLTWPGLATSLVIFLFAAFLAIALASSYQGMPGGLAIIDALLAQSIWIIAVIIGMRVTAAILKTKIRNLDVLIPAIYLLVGYLAVGSLLNMAFPIVVLLLTIALLYPMVQLGRMAASWPLPNAIGFAVLTVVLLVGLPQALYIVTNASALPPT